MMPTTSTCKALAHALRQELPGDLADANASLRAENERLRAEVNQLRAAAMSPYGNNVHESFAFRQRLSWKEFAEQRDQKARRLANKIDIALTRLLQAEHDACRQHDKHTLASISALLWDNEFLLDPLPVSGGQEDEEEARQESQEEDEESESEYEEESEEETPVFQSEREPEPEM